MFYLDGNFLAIGSHDNYIYIYAVAENGRKYSRVGKCSVSTCIYIPPSCVAPLFIVPPCSSFKFSFLYIWASTLSTLCVDKEAEKKGIKLSYTLLCLRRHNDERSFNKSSPYF